MSEIPGALPPSNVEAEERVLGAILLDPGCIPDVLSILKPEHFYRASHRAIYEAMLRVRASGEAVDMLTVADALKRAGKLEAAGGPEAVARLADDVSTARRAPSHARLIRDSYKLRALIQAAKSIEERAATGESDGADILNDALAAIQEIASDQAESVAVFTAQEMEGMEIERPPDLVTGLFWRGCVGFIAGEPKMKKSWLGAALTLALAAGSPFLGMYPVPAKARVLFVEEEDPDWLLVNRSGTGRLQRLWRAMTTVSRMPLPENLHLAVRQGIRIDDEGSFLRLSRLVERVRPDMVILDSFNRIHRVNPNLDYEIKPVLDNLDRLARTYGCAAVSIHHYNKQAQGGSTRGGQRMRGSGDIHARAECSLYVVRNDDSGQIVEVESKIALAARLLIRMEDEGEGGIRYIASPTQTPSGVSDANRDKLLAAIRELAKGPLLGGVVTLDAAAQKSGLEKRTATNHAKTLAGEGLIDYRPGRNKAHPAIVTPLAQPEAEDAGYVDPEEGPF